MWTRRLARAAAILLAGAGLALLGGQVYVKTKAALAAVLIDRAWELRLADGRPHRPWPWADMRPVARLEVPRLGVSRTVLSGASGQSLAFGLAHVSGTALPGEAGNVVIAGHRDTWAAFMRDLRPGDEILLLTRSGPRRYAVQSLAVLSRERVDALDDADGDRLTLITCYPFSGLLRGPWRSVIVCRRMEAAAPAGPIGDNGPDTSMRQRFVDIFIDPNPNCPDGCDQRFQATSEPRAVRRIRYSGGGGDTVECDVVGWASAGGGTPCEAHAVPVEDSGAGVATLLYGADWGLRFVPLDGRPPFGEPYLLIDDEAIVE